ncbi:hypothetical protein ACFPRL_25720 [Pseudoclavibacter helvolus]
MSVSLIFCQMMRVISSPSSSTTVPSTLIFAIKFSFCARFAYSLPGPHSEKYSDGPLPCMHERAVYRRAVRRQHRRRQHAHTETRPRGVCCARLELHLGGLRQPDDVVAQGCCP